jgi:hypothetical protein
MTWRTARPVLVSMIEGIATSSIYMPADYGPNFKHDPALFALQPDYVFRGRAFGIMSPAVRTKTMATGNDSRWRQQIVDLAVDYPMTMRSDELDDVIWSDYETLTERLLDVTTWQRPTSTIQHITTQEFDLEAATEFVEVDGVIRGRRMTIGMVVTHNRTG